MALQLSGIGVELYSSNPNIYRVSIPNVGGLPNPITVDLEEDELYPSGTTIAELDKDAFSQMNSRLFSILCGRTVGTDELVDELKSRVFHTNVGQVTVIEVSPRENYDNQFVLTVKKGGSTTTVIVTASDMSDDHGQKTIIGRYSVPAFMKEKGFSPPLTQSQEDAVAAHLFWH